jgi:hypothetical protein
MNRFKSVTAALAIVAVTSAAIAAAETDITGAWIVTLDFVNSKATMEANITQNDDKLAAEVITPAGKIDFNGTLVDNKITAAYSLRVQGNVLEIRMNGVVDAGSLSGTIAFGPGQEVKWTAVRKPVGGAAEATASEPAQVGTADSVSEPQNDVNSR